MSRSDVPDARNRRRPPAGLSDDEIIALIHGSPYLDSHSKRYWTAILAHLRPDHREALITVLLEAASGGPS